MNWDALLAGLLAEELLAPDGWMLRMAGKGESPVGPYAPVDDYTPMHTWAVLGNVRSA